MMWHVRPPIESPAAGSSTKLLAQFEFLYRAIRAPASCAELPDLYSQLARLPLPRDAPKSLRHHISNLRRFLQSHEHGAAIYELELLLIGLRLELNGGGVASETGNDDGHATWRSERASR